MSWLVHARKKRWDVFLIIQDVDALDSQIRKLLHEYTVDCMRLDRFGIPFVTRFTGLRLPKFFVGRVFYGRMNPPVRADTWYTSGKAAFQCYDTEQNIMDDGDVPAWGGDGPYSMLSNWHRVGRYLPRRRTTREFFHYVTELAITWTLRVAMVPAVLAGLQRPAKRCGHAPVAPEAHDGPLPLDLGPFIRHCAYKR